MTIIVTKSAGFCFGVKKTVEMALQESAKGEDIYTLGPIIHNPQVVSHLETKNIHAKNSVGDISDGKTVIIRTHGATLDDMNHLKNMQINLIDGTCPFVLRSQRMARRLSEQGYFVVIVGDEKHPEIKGVKSRTGNNSIVINPSANTFEIPEAKKIAVIAQTTLPEEDFNRVVEALKNHAEELKIVNTICRDTTIRQNEAKRIATQVDVVLVVGGRNSANTKKLARLCSEINPNTHHIESEEEIEPEWVDGKDRVGLATGASTPDWLIERVINKLKEIDEKSAVEQV